MQHTHTALVLASVLAVACAGPDKRTLAELHRVEPDTADVHVANGLDEALDGYRRFLEEAPESALTPEAMRRLADLKLEKEYGIFGGAEAPVLPAPNASQFASRSEPGGAGPSARL